MPALNGLQKAVENFLWRFKTPQKNPVCRGFSFGQKVLVLLLFDVFEVEDAEFQAGVYQEVVASKWYGKAFGVNTTPMKAVAEAGI